ncbi:hypothetical protein ILYODFUR_035112 [Ilyodon furcidens]|uniref:Uncharacterized protein n=1 Tax=Ilyodon furcidens TaxID=33524 RepID=A0ABV0V8R5_9TELE
MKKNEMKKLWKLWSAENAIKEMQMKIRNKVKIKIYESGFFICSTELWVIYFGEVHFDAGFAEGRMWGTKGAGLRTTLENWVTLRTRTHQRERAIQGHKGGSAGIGTGPILNFRQNSIDQHEVAHKCKVF